MEFDHDKETITPDNAENLLTIGGTGALIIPVGDTAQRPSVINGMLRYNTDTDLIEWVLAGVYKPSNLAGGLSSATTIISISTATAPVAGQVLTATSPSSANWQTPTGGGSGSQAQMLKLVSLRV